MPALLWTKGPTVFDVMRNERMTCFVRFVAWICPRCDRRNRTVVHRGPATDGPNGHPMTHEEIQAEYGRGPCTLSWLLGLVPGGDDEPTWSYGKSDVVVRGYPTISCGVCSQRTIISSHALDPIVGVGYLERTASKLDPLIPFHDPLGGAWDTKDAKNPRFPPPDVYL